MEVSGRFAQPDTIIINTRYITLCAPLVGFLDFLLRGFVQRHAKGQQGYDASPIQEYRMHDKNPMQIEQPAVLPHVWTVPYL